MRSLYEVTEIQEKRSLWSIYMRCKHKNIVLKTPSLPPLYSEKAFPFHLCYNKADVQESLQCVHILSHHHVYFKYLIFYLSVTFQ